ncbi:MAG: HD-GYP domain-containing protein [Actinomycetota bacterium]
MRRPSEQPRAWSNHVLVAVAAAVAAACVPFADVPALGHPLVMFGAFIALTELLDTDLAGGRRSQLSLAPAFAFAMLGGPAAASSGAATIALTYLVASAAAQGVRALTGRKAGGYQLLASFLLVATAAATYDALVGAGPIHLYGEAAGRRVHLASGTGIAAVLAVALLFEPARVALSMALDRDPAAPGSFRRTLRTTAPLQTAIVSVASLVALAFPKLGDWSFPLFLGPLAATRYAFRQITTIRTTEVQTLRALSKIPEMAGYTHPGHSRRVAELSVSMARHLGMAEDEVREIEYAALLHDIGRVVLEDPVAEADETSLTPRIAQTGADIVAAAGTFPRVARMIRDQHQPYRRRGEVDNDGVPSGARILRVANVFDDLARPGQVGLAPWDALERLHQGTAYDFDPAVVAALAAVLQREGAI